MEPHRSKVLTYFCSGQTLAHLSVQMFGHVGFPGSWCKRKASPCKVLSVTFKNSSAGAMQTICYLLKKIKYFAHWLNSKNNGPVVLFKYIFRHWNCLLSPVETDDKDRRRLKFEKIARPTFSSCNTMPEKSPKRFTLTYGKCSVTKLVSYLFLNSTKILCAWLITSAQNWPINSISQGTKPL